MSEQKKSGGSAKTKLLIGAIAAVVVIIVVVVGVSLVNPAPQTATPEATDIVDTSTEGDSAHSDMDFDAMFEASVQKELEALIADPDDLEACLGAAEAYYMWATYIKDGFFSSMHNPDELFGKAAEYYQFALDIDNESIEAIMGMGYAAFDRAQYRSSSGSGSEDERNELYQKGIDYFDKLLDHKDVNSFTDDEITNTVVNKSIALFALGKTDEAITLLEERKNEDADHARLFFNLGVFYETQENTDAAVECFDTAISLANEQGEEDLAAAAEKRRSALN